MEITEGMVDKLAGLARLNFSKVEKAAISADLQKMIAFVQKMDEADTSAVEPLLHMSAQKNCFRKDEVRGQVEQKAALMNAANHNENFFLVPKVIKQ